MLKNDFASSTVYVDVYPYFMKYTNAYSDNFNNVYQFAVFKHKLGGELNEQSVSNYIYYVENA